MAREDYQTTRYRFLKSINRCVDCARCAPVENFVRCLPCKRKVRKAGQAYQDSGKRRQTYKLKLGVTA
jgi:hypothetical protein